MSERFKYWAFISYSHKDTAYADWLHRALETYRVPKKLVGQIGRDGTVPKRVYPVFRDREELPTSADLGSNIEDALRDSKNLIVVCSPNAANSVWVNEEIKLFKAQGKAEQVLCLIVDGEPNASDQAGHQDIECFPDAVRYEMGSDGKLTSQRAEPIAADMRAGKDGKTNAKLKLLAGLVGVNFDDLKQRDLRRAKQRKALLTLASFVALIVIAAVLFMFEQQQVKRDFQYANNAVRVARNEIEQGRLTAGVLLAQHAEQSVRGLALGRFTNWLESLLDVPMSYQADVHRVLMIISQSLLTQAVSNHPWPTTLSTKITQNALPDRKAADLKVNLTKPQTDGKYVIQLSERGVVEVFDSQSHNLIREFSIENSSIDAFKLVGHHDWLVAFSAKRELAIWHIATGDKLTFLTFSEGFGKAIDIAVSASQRYLYLHTNEGKLWLLDSELDKEFSLSHLAPISAVAFRPGHNQLAISNDQGIRLIDLESGDLIAALKNNDGVTKLAFSQAGDTLTSYHPAGTNHYAMTGGVQRQRLLGRFGALQTIKLSPDGKWVVGLEEMPSGRADQGRTIHIWATETGRKVQSLKSKRSNFTSVSFDLTSEHVLALSRSGVEVWRRSSGELLHYISAKGHGFVLHPLGQQIATIGSGKQLTVWNLTNGELIDQIGGQGGQFTSVVFNSSGDKLATSSDDGFVLVWDIESKRIEARFKVATGVPTFIEFSNAGDRIAISATDKIIRIWDYKVDKVVELPGHDYELGRAHFSSDDAMLVTTDYPDFSSTTRKLAIRIWHARSGNLLHKLADHWNFGAPAARFLQASNNLITRADAIRIFDPLNGEIIAVFEETKMDIDEDGEQAVIKQGLEYYILPLPSNPVSLNQFIEETIPIRLTNSELANYFPQTPPLFGY